MAKIGNILGDAASFIEQNPAIIQLGSQAIAAATSYIEAAIAAHNAGVLSDEQIAAAWAQVTAGTQSSSQHLTDSIARYRAWVAGGGA